MAQLTSTSIIARNRSLDAIYDGFTRYVKIYDGSRPASPEDGPGAGVLGVTIDLLSSSPWQAASGASKATRW